MTTQEIPASATCSICADPSGLDILRKRPETSVGMHSHDFDDAGHVIGYVRMQIDIEKIPEVIWALADLYETQTPPYDSEPLTPREVAVAANAIGYAIQKACHLELHKEAALAIAQRLHDQGLLKTSED